jgi:hypothetical protein
MELLPLIIEKERNSGIGVLRCTLECLSSTTVFLRCEYEDGLWLCVWRRRYKRNSPTAYLTTVTRMDRRENFIDII